MNFELDKTQLRLQRLAAELCSGRGPGAEERLKVDNTDFPEELFRAMGEAGLFTHMLRPPVGEGGSFVDSIALIEELARHSSLACSLYIVNLACALMLQEFSDREQTRGLLRALAQGTLSLALAVTEREAGSDVGALTCMAEPTSGGFRLNGEKLFVTGALHAHAIITAVRDGQGREGKNTISTFLVMSDSDGLSIEPLRKLAQNRHASCRVRFEDVEIPLGALLGPRGKGLSVLKKGAALERLWLSAAANGTAAAVLAQSVQHAATRVQFGRPIGSFQAVGHQLADMKTGLEASRGLSYLAASKLDLGIAAADTISMAKLFASENALSTALAGMRIQGGRAYLEGNPVEHLMRSSFLPLFAGGTNEIQRTIIAAAIMPAAE